ncbi:hypothetical protein [Synechococcus sp. RedBA-s]|uniref:hypothetical protein n=1 Tax=Synechococcus sp. RedBA-s TaxID=2823741 RepID=UPI0020CBA233|nr:hypothetical protein [Synechococcus sp. RedBA-s]MCP9801392.1 hypothetical protein [Synechococcus sp. RedBA-s]
MLNDSQELKLFADYFPRLQEMCHQADYDPVVRFKQAEAASAINEAEVALIGLQAAPKDEQLDFTTLALAMMRS